jgi:hypothetical protein
MSCQNLTDRVLLDGTQRRRRVNETSLCGTKEMVATSLGKQPITYICDGCWERFLTPGAVASPALVPASTKTHRIDPEDEQTIQAAFERFHVAHPEVYDKLVEYARKVKNAGFAHFGLAFCWERTRWFFIFERDSKEKFKLNNNYLSRYSRRIMEQEEDLDGFFKTRRLLRK